MNNKILNNVCQVRGQRRRALVLLVAVILIIPLTMYNIGRGKGRLQVEAGVKKILLFNLWREMTYAAFGSKERVVYATDCHGISSCVYVNDVDLAEDEYDAIVINIGLLNKLPRLAGLVLNNTTVVSFTYESPYSTDYSAEYDDFFNMTMSYHAGADVRLFYGQIRARSPAEKLRDFKKKMNATNYNYSRGKTKAVACMVSHCETESKREEYVHELSKYIQVDIYGGCGRLQCPKQDLFFISDTKCYDMIERDYKFYLSFENAICDDYVTEKFFFVMQRNIVPVVYGGADYAAISPPHSYINALQFKPRELAEYLHQISNNDTLYNEFFWWKPHYQVDSGPETMHRDGFCQLCAKLHSNRQNQSYPSLDHLYSIAAQCRRPNNSLFEQN